jgi:sterol carrier protein 2
MTSARVFVGGVGLTPFYKPGTAPDYPELSLEACRAALADCKVTDIREVEHAVCGYVYGDSTCGQRCVYLLGTDGIPITNVNNNCSSGSSALFIAANLVRSGQAECVLVLGFEKMQRGSLGAAFSDRTNPLDRHVEAMADLRGLSAEAPVAAQIFGNAGLEFMERFPQTRLEHFAKVAQKNHSHSQNNPYAQFQSTYSLDDVLASPAVFPPILTKLQCCPTSDGAGAAVLCSESFVRSHGIENSAVEILGLAMASDSADTFASKSCLKLAGVDMTRRAAAQAYRQAGVTPADAQIVELHDCFSANELISYSALGLCKPQDTADFIDRGANTYGGQVVVNPSGGLLSKGHPLGATGLAQLAECVWQLRGVAGKRQVANAKLAIQHNIGLGGAAVVAVYKKLLPDSPDDPLPRHGGLNPATNTKKKAMM